jgi:hypothetical protein
MKTISFYSFLILITLSLFVSCKKADITIPDTTFTTGYNVYMAGIVNGSAVYWKNGIPTILGTNAIVVSGIALSDTDVYVSATVDGTNGALTDAVYWKDTTKIIITDSGLANANGIAVSGTDVYVSGLILKNSYEHAVIWKNGIPTYLAPYDTRSMAYQTAISGTDVYTTGYLQGGQVGGDLDTLVYWKNNVPHEIGEGELSFSTIDTSGTEVYIGGRAGNAAYFGVYATPFTYLTGYLTASKPLGGVTGIAVKGNDIYASGIISGYSGPSTAVYWKNGVETKLEDNALTYGIAIAGDDVYIVGTVNGISTPA